MSATKIASKHDCNYAINQGNSNETSVKLSKEFAPIFDLPDPNGEEYKFTLHIFKDDLCKMLSYIVSNLPLYDKKGNLVYFNSDTYMAKISEIQDFFGDNESAEYKVSVMNRKDRNICIQGFPKGLNIRDYMVEDSTVISMDKIDKTIEFHILPRYRAIENKIFNKHDIEEVLKYNTIQQIYYGAPGTGKSHEIKRQTEGMSVIRTTFHPDSDYSTFVGAYKPTMDKGQIIYTFTKQVFLKAYLKAWQKYAEVGSEIGAERQYLVIEEINRGNCAQIFGDLFQLLDRSENGFSSYSISADSDIRSAIADAFVNEEEYKLSKDINVDIFFPNYYSNSGQTISKDIQEGRILLLPPNLYIWATMNTSDQSLFPIDSAFKRRWDWEYVPIQYANDKWMIDIQGNKYPWVAFQKEVNKRIYKINDSEDKMLGDFFVKADKNDVISHSVFLNKILFYLWNDVCKDGEGDIFKKDEKTDLTFSDLYGSNGTTNLIAMMEYLGVKPIDSDKDKESNIAAETTD